ncbi:MAG: ribonuclease Z [Melioribacteraceae bacterium]
MNLKFIGTSSGQANLIRNHSSILFDSNTTKILIDCGDGISKSLLQLKIFPNEINKIIISHFHADHLAGLPSLLTQMIISKRKELINIYVPKGLLKTLMKFLQASFLFIDKYEFEINLIEFEFNKSLKLETNFSFLAKQNSHIINKHKLRIPDLEFISVSFLFEINDKKIIYTSDIGKNDDLYIFKDFNSDIFITETTHIELQEIENFVISQNPKKVILTHINFDDEIKIQNWHSSLPKNLHKKIKIAEDRLKVKL